MKIFLSLGNHLFIEKKSFVDYLTFANIELHVGKIFSILVMITFLRPTVI